jgi:hypothetical protein
MTHFMLVTVLLALQSTASAQACYSHQQRFDAFLNKYNPFRTGGPKATLTTIHSEFGAPTSVALSPNSDGTIVAYDIGPCRAEVVLDKQGFMSTTRVNVRVTPPAEADVRALRLAAIDIQIADLQRQLQALEEVRAALATPVDPAAGVQSPGARRNLPTVAPQGLPTSTVALPVVRGTSTVVATKEEQRSRDATTATSPSTSTAPTTANAYPNRQYTTKGNQFLLARVVAGTT